MKFTGFLLLMFSGLAGCATSAPPEVLYKTQTVEVPVPVKRTAPPDLTVPLKLDLPAFIAPGDAAASSCLSADGEKRMQLGLYDLRARIDGWEAWYAAP